MKLQKLINELERIAPPDYAMHWDNSGLQVGNKDQEISKVYIALDADAKALGKARDFGADLLITHHPLLFSGQKNILADNFIGKRIIGMIQSGISCYTMHTNYDIAVMSDLAAERLKLSDCVTLEKTKLITTMSGIQELGVGKCGQLPAQMTLAECAQFVKNAFDIPNVRIFGEPDTPVKRAAISPGSGKGMAEHALAHHCDVLISGDIGHHDGLDSMLQGLMVIDASHQGLEYIFVEDMKLKLEKLLPEIAVAVHENTPPFLII